MRRSKPNPDYLLLTFFSLAALVPVGFIDLTGTGEFRFTMCLWRAVRGDTDWPELLGRALVTMPLLCVPAVALGWWAQAAAVRLGFRLTPRPAKEDQADYQEAQPGAPPEP
jgi:hypothetical protein